MSDGEVKRHSLPPVVQLWVSEKEQELEKVCKKFWFYTNPHDVCFLFGEFHDVANIGEIPSEAEPTIVTIAEDRGESLYIEVAK